jgi:hypothetical protein
MSSENPNVQMCICKSSALFRRWQKLKHWFQRLFHKDAPSQTQDGITSNHTKEIACQSNDNSSENNRGGARRMKKAEGYLNAKGKLLWSERWCVVENSLLKIFKDDKSTSPDKVLAIKGLILRKTQSGNYCFLGLQQLCDLLTLSLQVALNTKYVSYCCYKRYIGYNHFFLHS